MTDTDQLIAALDARYDRWDIWRAAHDKRWIVRVEHGKQGESFADASMPEAMRLALEWQPLPMAPPPPDRMSIDAFAPRKDGSKWRLEYNGWDCSVRLDTKRQAIEYAQRCVEQSNAKADEWEREHGWTRHKAEGVDFRWER